MNRKSELPAEVIVENLTQPAPQVSEFRLDSTVIKGRLDLRHRRISVAVMLTDCIFTDEVDLRHCEFEQCVDFSGSQFVMDFESHGTIYRKYVYFNRAIFESGAIFDDAQCEGEVRFCGTRFENQNEKTRFVGARFRELVYRGEHLLDLEYEFRRDLDRNEISDSLQGQFERASLPLSGSVNVSVHERGAKWLITDKDGEEAYTVVKEEDKLVVYKHQRTVFKGGASFNGLVCERIGNFSYVLFENPNASIDFTCARFAELNCVGTVFKGVPVFSGLRCDGNGFFRNARFDNDMHDVNFVDARFGTLDCDGTLFKGGVDFRGFQCKDVGFFGGALFTSGRSVDFTSAKLGQLNCNGVIFGGIAIFNSLQCEKSGSFRNARFEDESQAIDFTSALFDNLECSEATFKGGAIFNGVNCKRNGIFKNVRFGNREKKTDFGHTSFGGSLELQDAIFMGSVDFEYACISGRIALWGTRFWDKVSFNGANIHSLSLIDQGSEHHVSSEYCWSSPGSLPFMAGSVDLRRFMFDIFEGTKGQQRYVVAAQSPEKFSQDPYLQFEQYYRSTGDDDYARSVYYEGRLALRKTARLKRDDDTGPSIDRWPWLKAKLDWLLCWTVGYGVKTRRLLVWILAFVLIGICVFWPDGALLAKESSRSGAEGLTIARDNQTGKAKQLTRWLEFIKTPLSGLGKTGDMKEDDPFANHLFYRIGYSLDLFIPIVDLRIAKDYHLPQGWRGGYAVVHVIVGWLLVPLLLASMSGIIKKKQL